MIRDYQAVLRHLAALSSETEWVERKVNDARPDDIGEYISAIANVCPLVSRDNGYVVWGIDDKGSLVGTTFRPEAERVGGHDLEDWLAVGLKPRPDFRFLTVEAQGMKFVILDIPSAIHTPIRFKDEEYIRVGSLKKKLRDYAEKERQLWASFPSSPWERNAASDPMTSSAALSKIDAKAFLERLAIPVSKDQDANVERLKEEAILRAEDGNLVSITNLGAILAANDLKDFPSLARKAPRVIVYKGKDRIASKQELEGKKGYALGFDGLVNYINSLLPRTEQIEGAMRKERATYPEIAIRELAANALIHQDFTIAGSGPMVEIFEDRVEITNPGVPLVDTNRFIDSAPQSRNDRLASIMRRIGFCEERGSGIDKVVFSLEEAGLPAPEFIVQDVHTKAVVFGPRKLSRMSRGDRVRACYFHCCLKYVSNERMTNTSLRRRFAIADSNYPLASRIIRETIQAGAIKADDDAGQSKRNARYVPFWA